MRMRKDCNDWPEYKMLIMDQIEGLEERQNYTEQQVQSTAQNILALQNKMALYETLAGIVPVLIMIVIAYLKFHNKLRSEHN